MDGDDDAIVLGRESRNNRVDNHLQSWNAIHNENLNSNSKDAENDMQISNVYTGRDDDELSYDFSIGWNEVCHRVLGYDNYFTSSNQKRERTDENHETFQDPFKDISHPSYKSKIQRTTKESNVSVVEATPPPKSLTILPSIMTMERSTSSPEKSPIAVTEFVDASPVHSKPFEKHSSPAISSKVEAFENEKEEDDINQPETRTEENKSNQQPKVSIKRPSSALQHKKFYDLLESQHSMTNGESEELSINISFESSVAPKDITMPPASNVSHLLDSIPQSTPFVQESKSNHENNIVKIQNIESSIPYIAQTPTSIPKAPVLAKSVTSLFTTGGGKSIVQSEDSLKKAREWVNENENDVTTAKNTLSSTNSEISAIAKPISSVKPSPSLFSTGGGKSLSISEDSLRKAREWVNSNDDSNEKSKISLENLPLAPKQPTKSTASLFSTGKDKPIFVTPENVMKARAQLEESANDEPKQPIKTNSNPLILAPVISASFNQAQNQTPATKVASSLFSTGGGKSVSISSESLEKARKILETPTVDESIGHIKQTTSKTKTDFTTQSTISNSNIKQQNFSKSATNGISSTGFKRPRPLDQSKQIVQNTNSMQLAPTTRERIPKSDLPSLKLNFDSISRVKSHLLPIKRPQFIPDSICNDLVILNSENAVHVTFSSLDEQISASNRFIIKSPPTEQYPIGWLQMKKELISLENASSSFNVSDAWVANHYRWIIWKLGSIERIQLLSEDGSISEKTSLTAKNVLGELRTRFRREIANGERSILRKILEGDRQPGSHIAVIVSKIVNINNTDGSCLVEISDGWYAVEAILDRYLGDLLRSGKIFIGGKIFVSGAQMIGNDNGVAPLEIRCNNVLQFTNSKLSNESGPQPRLSIGINNTLPAPWHTKLGLQRQPSMLKRLSSLKPNGGTLPYTVAIIYRVSDVLYLEHVTNSSGSKTSVIRSKAEEQRIAAEYERSIEDHRARVASRIVQEWEKKNGNGDESNSDGKSNQFRDISEFNYLIDVALKSDPNIPKPREVLSLIRIKLLDLIPQSEDSHQNKKSTTFQLTIFKPTPELIMELREGRPTRLFNLKVTNMDAASVLHLTALSSTKWEFMDRPSRQESKAASSPSSSLFLDVFGADALSRSGYQPRSLASIENLSNLHNAEIDTVGILVRIEQNRLFLASGNGEGMLCLVPSLYSGSNENRFFPKELSSKLSIGAIVSLRNILLRSYDPRSKIQSSIFTEESSYTVKATSNPYWNHLCEEHKKLEMFSVTVEGKQFVSMMSKKIEDIITGNAFKHDDADRLRTSSPTSFANLDNEVSNSSSLASMKKKELQRQKKEEWVREYQNRQLRQQTNISNDSEVINGVKESSNNHQYMELNGMYQQYPVNGVWEIKIKEPYMTNIMLGRKTIDVHLDKGFVKRLKAGDRVKYVCGKLFQICEIKAVHNYASFKALVDDQGYQTIFPKTTASNEEALAMLRTSFGSDDMEFGAVALEISACNVMPETKSLNN